MVSVPKVPLLAVKDLWVGFGQKQAAVLKGVNFELPAGEICAMVGESGSGKSLTALSLMGLLPRTAWLRGSITLQTDGGETALEKLSPQAYRKLRGREMAMVFQEPMNSLNPLRTIGSQLAEMLDARAETKLERKQRVAAALTEVHLPRPDALLHSYPHQLSGGQLQRVMIAMMLLRGPRLLLADEPTTALDTLVQHELLLLLRTLAQQQGTAILFITHDLVLAKKLADRVLVMYQGELVEDGAVGQVFDAPKHAYTRALMQVRPQPQHKGYLLPTVRAAMEGNVELDRVERRPASAEVLLHVQDVWKAYGREKQAVPALQGIDLAVHRGERLGLIGASGCGKSTLAKIILGLEQADKGNLIWNADKDEEPGKHLPRARRLQLVFQDPYSSLNPRMTIGDALAEPMWVHGMHRSYADCVKAAEALLEQVELPKAAAGRYPFQFSGGQRQRIVIARALALSPQLLVCDEAVAALDVSVQAQVLNLLQHLANTHALTLLFISHDMQVVHYLSDRIAVMDGGQIVELNTADGVYQNPSSDMAKKLIEAAQ